MHILVVADEAWVLDEVHSALGESRYRITDVSDPQAAVETAREAGPDAAVVDMQVASMGGMAVARALREAAGAGTIGPTPTILLLDRGADAFLAGRSGAAGWVRKPFTAFELREALDALAAPTSAE